MSSVYHPLVYNEELGINECTQYNVQTSVTCAKNVKGWSHGESD